MPIYKNDSEKREVKRVKAIPEREFQKQVIELAHLFGWKVCEFRKARLKKRGQDTYRTPFGADGMGFPDLVLARELDDGNFVCIMAELKSKKGKLSDWQKEWLKALIKVEGIFVFLWRPGDFDDILATLQSRGLPDIIKICKKNALYVESLLVLNQATPASE